MSEKQKGDLWFYYTGPPPMEPWSPPPCVVYAECDRVWIDQRLVKFINIEEDEWGRDRVDFRCPRCEQLHISLRLAS